MKPYSTFADAFADLTGQGFLPRKWQAQLAADPSVTNRLIRIPTGFGKTMGILAAWAWNRLLRDDPAWPRRLVWCLPMRVLVEQTESEARHALQQLGVLWNGRDERAGTAAVHCLMGGSNSGDWHLYPEQCTVLIGTQDMLLSRALNRGFGASRARWPMDFGLLNQDALWVMDEVQLMDVGLATSAQLQAFRQVDAKAGRELRPCRTWWMSATLQPAWLRSVDTVEMLEDMPEELHIPSAERQGELWDVRKSCEVVATPLPRDIARLVSERHKAATLTLVVVNTVDTATELYELLRKDTLASTAELRLVHSRFRPEERKAWREDFLNKLAPIPAGGRVIVATQVIEAGVDVSATTLITELSPWPSLVQRFGRCARYAGETGHVCVLDRGWTLGKDDSRALPYQLAELVMSKESLLSLTDVSPRSLEEYEGALSDERRSQLYPYQPRHLLLQREWTDLFDTTPDLTGADIDIGRFIRTGEELDIQVFWRDVPGDCPSDDWKPRREELCSVPFRRAQEWLCGKETKEKRAPRLRDSIRAWVWDWIDGCWKQDTRRADILPGRVVLVDARCGGYSTATGWSPQSAPVTPLSAELPVSAEDRADDAQDSEALSAASEWKTIATHGCEAEAIARAITTHLRLDDSVTAPCCLAAVVHDIGKSLRFFQGSIGREDRPQRQDLAKAPDNAWAQRKMLYRAADGERRPGLRHELASALALFNVLQRCRPGHPGLLGEYGELLGATRPQEAPPTQPGEWERRILDLADSETFNLVVYLVASHHGKVRVSLHASPVDQDYQPASGDDGGPPIRGIREADQLPQLHGERGKLLIDTSTLTLEPAYLGLSAVTGPSWTERTLGLLERHGPGSLALLEAIVRAADIRASRLTTPDPLLEQAEP